MQKFHCVLKLVIRVYGSTLIPLAFYGYAIGFRRTSDNKGLIATSLDGRQQKTRRANKVIDLVISDMLPALSYRITSNLIQL
jgi:hypothetical protein